jgi:hypothetical protein
MAQITGGPHRGHAAGDTDVEKQASQLASDTKYKVKQRMGANVSKMSPAAVTKAYLAQLAKSPAPGPVKALAQKKLSGGSLKEEHNIDGLASSTVANAMFKVFVEGIQKEETEPEIQLSYLNKLLEDTDTKKYKVVVTDKKTGNQYRRMATREKIAELRANPNIQSVEISSYGEPIGSEKNSGEQTAKVKSGKGLDYDGDGKVESGAKEHAGAVHNAIQRKKGGVADGKDTSNVKEAVEAPVAPAKRPTKGQNDAEIVSNEEKGMDNTKLINVFPELKLKETTYGKFLNMIQEKTLTTAETKKKEEIVKSMKKSASDFEKRYPGRGKEVMYATATKQAKKVAEETESDTKKKDEKEVDPRSIPTKINLLKNKLRSAGIKSPVFMMAAEETVEEGMGLSVGISKIAGQLNANPRTSAEQGAKNFQKNVADPIGNAVKGAARAVLQPANNSPEAQKARKDKYRPEEIELEGEMIDERRKEDKVAETPRKPRDKAFELVSKSMGASRMGVQPRGQKKEPGKKPPAAGERGGPISPAQKVQRNRDIVKRGEENMGSRFD